ncbi:hypothetical protein [Streptosporangium sp. NPDC004631]
MPAPDTPTPGHGPKTVAGNTHPTTHHASAPDRFPTPPAIPALWKAPDPAEVRDHRPVPSPSPVPSPVPGSDPSSGLGSGAGLDLNPGFSPASSLGPGSADTARDLEARNPGWAILWRPWARRYWAFPCWITTHPEPIETRNPHDLINLIQQTELHHPPPGDRYPPPYQHNQWPTA